MQDRKRRERNTKSKAEKAREMMTKEHEEFEVKKQVMAEEEKEKVKQKLREMSDNRTKAKKEREKKAREWKRRMSNINGKVYLYKRFEDDFKKAQLPEIKEKEKILKTKKDL